MGGYAQIQENMLCVYLDSINDMKETRAHTHILLYIYIPYVCFLFDGAGDIC